MDYDRMPYVLEETDNWQLRASFNFKLLGLGTFEIFAYLLPGISILFGFSSLYPVFIS